MPPVAPLSKNSTNVRLPWILRAQLAGLRSASHLWPAAAAPWAEHLFFTPRRHARPARETEVLRSARRFDLHVGGERLAAWSWGRGPTVLLVHGWEGRGAQLGALVAPLVEHGLRVVTYDGPAHGASTGQQTTVFAFARALREVAEHLGELHGLVAHSFGAAATTVALKDGLAARRLVYVAPWCSLYRAADNFGAKLGLSTATSRLLNESLERRFAERRADFDTRAIAASLSMIDVNYSCR